MGKKQRGTKVMNNGAGRGRLAWAWSLLAVATAICVSVGACALLLPDRAPALLGRGDDHRASQRAGILRQPASDGCAHYLHRT